MFEKAVIRGVAQERGVDIGLVAETLLFYKKVHLVLDRGSMPELVAAIGLKSFLDLSRRPDVEISFSHEMLGVQTDTPPVGDPTHVFVQFSIHADAKGKPQRYKEQLDEALSVGATPRPSAELLERLRHRIRPAPLPSGAQSIPRATLSDCHDPA